MTFTILPKWQKIAKSGPIEGHRVSLFAYFWNREFQRNQNKNGNFFITKFSHSRPLFSLCSSCQRSFLIQLLVKILPMTGFEPQISGIGSSDSTYCATITAHGRKVCIVLKVNCQLSCDELIMGSCSIKC